VKPFNVDVNEGALGFQIAPMIDVVFVIMLFFMVMAGQVKVEREINSRLPGNAETTGAVEFVDEQVIVIQENGQVELNEEPMDTPESRELQTLKNTLKRLKENCDAAKTKAVVVVNSAPTARYERTMDVLDSLAFAKIDQVSFAIIEEE
jgi:biopolymer transport protein ExbD